MKLLGSVWSVAVVWLMSLGGVDVFILTLLQEEVISGWVIRFHVSLDHGFERKQCYR